MNTELEALEAKIEKVAALVNQLRAEIDMLQQQKAVAEAEGQRLRQVMDAARGRLEGLMDKIPEDA